MQFVAYHPSRLINSRGKSLVVESVEMETIYHYTCVDVQDVPLSRIPETQVFAGAQGLIEVLILNSSFIVDVDPESITYE